jgi:hypothetical protein
VVALLGGAIVFSILKTRKIDAASSAGPPPGS